MVLVSEIEYRMVLRQFTLRWLGWVAVASPKGPDTVSHAFPLRLDQKLGFEEGPNVRGTKLNWLPEPRLDQTRARKVPEVFSQLEVVQSGVKRVGCWWW